MTFAPQRPQSIYGRPGAASGIVSPIDWRTAGSMMDPWIKAGETAGKAVGGFFESKAKGKAMGDKARAALKPFMEDLNMSADDIAELSGSEAMGLVSSVEPMLASRRVDAAVTQSESAQSYYNRLELAEDEKKEDITKTTDALRIGLDTGAEEYEKMEAYINAGGTRADWEVFATEQQKASVRYFDSALGQHVLRGGRVSTDQYIDFVKEGLTGGYGGAPGGEAGVTVEKHDDFTVILGKDGRWQALPTQRAGVDTSQVAAMKEMQRQQLSGNFKAASIASASSALGGSVRQLSRDPDDDTLIVMRPEVDTYQNQMAQADMALVKIQEPIARQAFINSVNLLSGLDIKGQPGAEQITGTKKARSVVQEIGRIVTENFAAEKRATWFNLMGVTDPGP